MGKIFEALEEAKRTRRVIPTSFELNALQETPSILSEDLVVVNDRDPVMAECFRFLRSKILRPAEGASPRTILVTSALTGEGKTFVASNLAAMISQGIDEFVLLMDTDLRRCSVHQLFGLGSVKEGLSTYLAGDTPLSSILKKTCIDKLSVLPAGNSTNIPSELLSSDKMRGLIREVRDRYPDRYVIIDSPPVEFAPETAVIANEVDGILFVVRYGMSPRSAVRAALKRLPKEKILGLVFNGYSKTVQFYGRYGLYKYGEAKKK
jgi:exopolysaccharide/PEP-CTERM locus tyrosine autokinase